MPRIATMAQPLPKTEHQPTLVLRGVSWDTYDRLVTEITSPARLTFDRGELEIVSPSHRHEIWKTLVCSMIRIMTMELAIPIKSGGSTTLRKKLLERGMEPDASYWVQSEAAVRGKLELDFDVHPVPDLALESEATRSVRNRLEILAALGVGEVWRYDGTKLIALLINEAGSYESSEASRCFPWLPLPEFVQQLHTYSDGSETEWALRFRAWVRSNFDIGRDRRR